VRVGYAIHRAHADILDKMLVAIRRSTGDACSASELIRVAIEQLARQPLDEVMTLVEKTRVEMPKRRRRDAPR